MHNYHVNNKHKNVLYLEVVKNIPFCNINYFHWYKARLYRYIGTYLGVKLMI